MWLQVALAVKFTNEWVRLTETSEGFGSGSGRVAPGSSLAIVGVSLAPFEVTFDDWADFTVETGMVCIGQICAFAVYAGGRGH